MLPNPSHLEAVNPLLYGSVRAIMQATNDPLGK
jgi:2-oxoglutarate dehydrogenase complex dehydrogenase (E1) component-like enzyme